MNDRPVKTRELRSIQESEAQNELEREGIAIGAED